MHPFFFGSSGRRLFGIYHAPGPSAVSSTAVVVCPPIGHEYIRSHRTLRNLSVDLAAAGCHVLRFDYYGTGDSGGDGADGCLDQWRADIVTSVEELREIGGTQAVVLIGLRLGCALAVNASLGRSDVSKLLLWDPVLDGRDYLARTLALQRAWVSCRPQLRRAFREGGTGQILGFPLTDTQREQLESVDLSSVVARVQAPVAVFAPAGASPTDVWVSHLRGGGTPVEYLRTSEGSDWDRPTVVHGTFLPSKSLLERIVAQAAKVGL